MCFHRAVPVNYILLTVFTCTVSLLVSTVCTMVEPLIVVQAALMTAGMVVALTIYAMTTKTDFTSSLCSIAVAVVFLASFLMLIPLMIFYGFLFHMVYLALCVALFGFYILWDTQMIMGGNHKTHSFSEDDYILAAVILYLDIIQMFLYILEILSRLKGE